MPAVNVPAKVLVTGANGCIAVWILRALLDHGYSVRGTVRSEAKTAHLRKIFKDEVENGRLEFVLVPDMTPPGAFDEAVKGVDAILHTASPILKLTEEDPDEFFIKPAVNGAVRVLESAHTASGSQVKRVIYLSSIGAVWDPNAKGSLDERVFNEGSVTRIYERGRDADKLDWYLASKVLAEKAAWDFFSKHKSSLSWDLVVLIPPAVFGPALHEVGSPKDLTSSAALFYDALAAKEKQSSNLFETTSFVWTDVHDVAEAHIRALEAPNAAGERFILSSGPYTWHDWYETAKNLDLAGVHVPAELSDASNKPKYELFADTSKARNILGMNFRDKATTLKDVFEDYKRRGWLQEN